MSVLLFAWDKTEAAACDKKEYLARLVDSSAMSASIILPNAARILVFCEIMDSELKANLE